MNILEQKLARDQKLSDILNELADVSTKITNKASKIKYYNCFKAIYSEIKGETLENKKYRHKYSLILSLLIEFESNPQKDLNNLANNVEIIYQFAANKQHEVKESIEKLYDHINLDFARLDYIKTSHLTVMGDISKKIFQVEEQKKKIEELQNQYDEKFGQQIKELNSIKEEFADEINEQEKKNKENNVTLLYTMIGTILSFSILAGSFEAIMSLPLVSQRVMVMLSSIAIVFITLYYVKMLNFDNENKKLNKHLKIVIGCVILLILGTTIGIFFEYNWYANTIDAYEEKNAELLKRIEILEEKTNNQISVNSYGFPVTAVQQ